MRLRSSAPKSADRHAPLLQPGVSMPELFSHYGSEEQCSSVLKALRWPQGFHCPRCNATEHWVVGHGSRTLFR